MNRFHVVLGLDAALVALGLYGIWPGSAFHPEALVLWPDFAAGLVFWTFLFAIEGAVLVALGSHKTGVSSHRQKVAVGFVSWALVSYALSVLVSPVTVGMPLWFRASMGGSLPIGLGYLFVGIGVRMLQRKPAPKKEAVDDPLRLKIIQGVGRRTSAAIAFDPISVSTQRLPSDWEQQKARIAESEPEFLKDPYEVKLSKEWKWFGIGGG
ncbi:MAG: hypothetical protein JRM77_04745 [Nitrososphaerota archaeon]|nr:hypothetical protein [Nitrososphaerota archaeon]